MAIVKTSNFLKLRNTGVLQSRDIIAGIAEAREHECQCDFCAYTMFDKNCIDDIGNSCKRGISAFLQQVVEYDDAEDVKYENT